MAEWQVPVGPVSKHDSHADGQSHKDVDADRVFAETLACHMPAPRCENSSRDDRGSRDPLTGIDQRLIGDLDGSDRWWMLIRVLGFGVDGPRRWLEVIRYHRRRHCCRCRFGRACRGGGRALCWVHGLRWCRGWRRRGRGGRHCRWSSGQTSWRRGFAERHRFGWRRTCHGALFCGHSGPRGARSGWRCGPRWNERHWRYRRSSTRGQLRLQRFTGNDGSRCLSGRRGRDWLDWQPRRGRTKNLWWYRP